MTELKPCPFCGSSDVSRSWKRATQIAIECMNCEASGPVLKGESMQEAKDNARATWNTRVSPWRSLKNDPSEPNAPVESLKTILVKNPSRDHWHGRIVKLVRDGVTWVDDDNEDPWTLEQYADSGCTEWMEVPE